MISELYLEALELCFYCLPANSVRNILFCQDFELHILNHVQWQELVTHFGNYLLYISNYSLIAHLSKIYPIKIYFTEKFTKIFIAIMTTFFHKTSDRKLDDYSICTFVHCTCKILEMLPIFTIIDNYLIKNYFCFKNISSKIHLLKNSDIMKKTLIKICDFGFSHLVLKPSYRVSKLSSARKKKLTLEISSFEKSFAKNIYKNFNKGFDTLNINGCMCSSKWDIFHVVSKSIKLDKVTENFLKIKFSTINYIERKIKMLTFQKLYFVNLFLCYKALCLKNVYYKSVSNKDFRIKIYILKICILISYSANIYTSYHSKTNITNKNIFFKIYLNDELANRSYIFTISIYLYGINDANTIMNSRICFLNYYHYNFILKHMNSLTKNKVCLFTKNLSACCPLISFNCLCLTDKYCKNVFLVCENHIFMSRTKFFTSIMKFKIQLNMVIPKLFKNETFNLCTSFFVLHYLHFIVFTSFLVLHFLYSSEYYKLHFNGL